MTKLGIAIIGMGNISISHLNGYLKENKRCEVKALCDIYPEKCKIFAEKCNFNIEEVTITSDYKTLLDRKDIEAVSICLPPSHHCQISIDFLNHGKNVICEKPMAASLEEADKMIEAEKRNNKILCIVSQNRFKNDAMKVKKLIEKNVFGKILLTRVNSMWYRGENYYKLWWRGTWEKEGGGCTLNHSVHQIDMLQWYLGLPNYICSIFDNLNHSNSEVEDTSLTILKYPNSLAEINVSLNDMDEKQEFFFQSEKASFTIPWSVHCVKQLENGFYEDDIESTKDFEQQFNALPDLKAEGHDGQISNFLDAIENKDKLIVSSQDGRAALELIYAIYKSAIEKKYVNLPLTQNDNFYNKEKILKVVPKFFEKSESVENIILEKDISLGK